MKVLENEFLEIKIAIRSLRTRAVVILTKVQDGRLNAITLLQLGKGLDHAIKTLVIANVTMRRSGKNDVNEI